MYANCCVWRYITLVCGLPVGLGTDQTVRYMLTSGLQTFWWVVLPLDRASLAVSLLLPVCYVKLQLAASNLPSARKHIL